MEILSFSLSLLALVFSGFTYCLHDKKLKQQASLINKYEIEKFEAERIQRKKAIIHAEVISHSKGHRELQIRNLGQSIARKVIIRIPDVEGLFVTNNPFPMDMQAHSSVEITLHLSEDCPRKIDLQAVWQDEFKEDNFEILTIQLY